jgi:prepilin-type N-terminal cleavage/methylation domain-containing protein
MTRGFSLLEVLAATVVLGLLAVAVVPLTGRLVSDDGRVYNQLTASELLHGIDPTSLPRAGIAMPLDDHPGWWLRSERLTPIVPPSIPGQADLRPQYSWLRVLLVDGPGVDAEILAERLLLSAGGGP